MSIIEVILCLYIFINQWRLWVIFMPSLARKGSSDIPKVQWAGCLLYLEEINN